MNSIRLFRRLRLRFCLGLALLSGSLGVHDALAGPDLRFDGKTETAEFADGQRLSASDIGVIALSLSREAGTEAGAVFMAIRGPDTFFYVGYTDDGAALTFDTASGVHMEFGKGLGANTRLQLALDRDGWIASIDGVQAGLLLPDFLPKPEERLELQVGGPGFVGAIGVDVTSRDGMSYAHTGSHGRLLARALPRLGTYVRQDSGRTGVQPEDLPGVDKDHHGVFKKQTFYALTAVPGGVALAVDWGGILELVPDPDDGRRYIPKDAAYAWAGAVEFADGTAPGDVPQFTSVGSYATDRKPFLLNDVVYVRRPPRTQGEGEQLLGSVWATTAFPPNFTFTLNSCYNVVKMNLSNFQETGCGGNALFALPPAQTGAYTNIGPHILPFGWKWYVDIVHEEAVFSTLIGSSQDTSSAYSGSSSSQFNVLGYQQSHNEAADREYRDLVASERMQSVQQYFERKHSIVLDPDVVYLDPCFVRRVLRAAAGLEAARLGIDAAQLTAAQLPKGPDYFEPARSLRECPERLNSPYPVGQFLKDYGTHYAHAITYGARAIRTATFDKREMLRMVTDGHDLQKSEGFEFEATLGNKNASYVVKGGFESGSGSQSKTGATTSQNYKVDETHTKCFGGVTCSHGEVSAGNEPIPIYLDLVRLDALLAPPYFDDIAVIRDLRRALASQLDKALAGSARPYIPPVVRVLDIQFDHKACSYAPGLYDGKGLAPLFGWVEGLCGKVDNLLLAFYDTDGVSATPHPLVQSSPVQPLTNQVDTPSLKAVTRCFRPSSGGAKCDRPTYRVVVQPVFDRSGVPKAGQRIGLQLFENATALKTIPGCGRPCDVKIGFWISDEPAAMFAHWDEPVVFSTSAIGFSQAEPAPSIISGKAVAFYRYNMDDWNKAAHFTKVPAEWFSAELAFTVEDVLPGLLGFAAPPAAPGVASDFTLASLRPGTVFPWLIGDAFDSRGMFRRCEAVFGSGNCRASGAVVEAKPDAERRYNVKLTNSSLCQSDGICQSGACARASAGDGELPRCCPSGRSGLYGGALYCLGMLQGSQCWSNAQCASGVCRNSLGGLQRGLCK